MNIEELQDALKRIPEDWNGSVTWREPVLVLRKYARLVANPNIEAAGKLLQRKVNSMREIQGHDPTPKHFAHWLNDLVAAASTPQGDTE